MKNYIPHIIAFAAGALIASLVFLLINANNRKIDQNGVLVKTETITKVDTVVVTKEQIVTKVIEKEGPTEYVYVELPPEVVRDTVYRDRVVPLEKKHYLTASNDMKIYHSGIFSQIDSVVNYRETKVVNNVYRQDVKNNISIGLEAGYCLAGSIPLYFQYERMLHKNVGVYGRAYHDLYTQSNGVAIGVRLRFGW
jgi:hypothetical protein